MWPKPAGISGFLGRPSINGRRGTPLAGMQRCVTRPGRRGDTARDAAGRDQQNLRQQYHFGPGRRSIASCHRHQLHRLPANQQYRSHRRSGSAGRARTTDNGAEFQSQFHWHLEARHPGTSTSGHARRISTGKWRSHGVRAKSRELPETAWSSRVGISTGSFLRDFR